MPPCLPGSEYACASFAGRPAASGNHYGGNQVPGKHRHGGPRLRQHGCGRLTLVSPAWWDKEKARPLATAKGEPLLDAIEVKPTLGDALAPNVLTFGTTARTAAGGAGC